MLPGHATVMDGNAGDLTDAYWKNPERGAALEATARLAALAARHGVPPEVIAAELREGGRGAADDGPAGHGPAPPGQVHPRPAGKATADGEPPEGGLPGAPPC